MSKSKEYTSTSEDETSKKTSDLQNHCRQKPVENVKLKNLQVLPNGKVQYSRIGILISEYFSWL